MLNVNQAKEEINVKMVNLLKDINVKSALKLKGDANIEFSALSTIKMNLEDMIKLNLTIDQVLKNLNESPSFNRMPSSEFCNKMRKIVLNYFKSIK